MDSLIKDILSYHVICNVIIPHHAITSDGGAASQWPHTHASSLSLCWLALLIQTTHNVAKRPFGISISERLYLFSRTPSGAPNGSPALTYKWTTQLLKEIAPPWPLDLSEGHGGGPGVVGDEQH